MTEDELREIIAEFDRAGEQLKAADEERLRKRDEGLRKAKAEGWKQSELIRFTGYSRETMRQALDPDARQAARDKRTAKREAAKKGS